MKYNQNTKRDNSDRKQIRFGDLLEQINTDRGGEDLASWVKDACRQKLKANAEKLK